MEQQTIRQDIAALRIAEHSRHMVNWASHVLAGAMRVADPRYPSVERRRRIVQQAYLAAQALGAATQATMAQECLPDVVGLDAFEAWLQDVDRAFVRTVLHRAILLAHPRLTDLEHATPEQLLASMEGFKEGSKTSTAAAPQKGDASLS